MKVMYVKSIERYEALKQLDRLRIKLEALPQSEVKKILSGAYFSEVERKINIIYNSRSALEQEPSSKTHVDVAIMSGILDEIRPGERIPKCVKNRYISLKEKINAYKLKERKKIIKYVGALDKKIGNTLPQDYDDVKNDIFDLEQLVNHGPAPLRSVVLSRARENLKRYKNPTCGV